MTDSSIEPSALLRENTAILQRFESEGVDLLSEKEFEFTVSLSDSATCKELRSILRAEHKWPKDTLFMVINDPEDYRLAVFVDMKPSATAITELEEKLILASDKFEDAEVSWEFKG